MFLNKIKLIISLCFFTSFICAWHHLRKVRFTKEGEKHFLHLFFDSKRLKYEKIEVSSGCSCVWCGGDKNFEVLFTIKECRLGNELIVDISGINRNSSHRYNVEIYTTQYGRYMSETFFFNQKEDSFISVVEDNKLMAENTN